MDTFTSLIIGFEKLDEHLKDDRKRNKNTGLRNAENIAIKNLDSNLEILNESILSHTKTSDLTTSKIKNRSIKPYDETNTLHSEVDAAMREYSEAKKRLEEAKMSVKGNNSRALRYALKAAQSAVKATQAMYQTKVRAYTDSLKQDDNKVNSFVDRRNEKAVRGVMSDMVSSVSRLKGRGLRGAGVAPLEGVVRRGRTYNLNEIQGLATPSAYVYRQHGSKYIRIPDLDNKSLVIVQPNRRKCGPKRQIGEGLQSMIRTLTFKQHIDQAAYDKLSIDDKKLFKEILAITHLQYCMTDSRTR
ncbi:unnamed protein product [Phytophthora lilii]|uniref:Unnamed protein product n=1 Tax=Phytophthora lilii TaxID=2077276 RepID=A0A9W6U973_9STRA|nr:unnamed protein product [Phytophthora lilii]